MPSSSKKILVSDLDNTLYNFVDYFSPSIRGLANVISKELNVTEDVVYQEFGALYESAESIEFNFIVQRSALFSDLPDWRKENLIELLIKVVSGVQRKRLLLYDSVYPTLEFFQKRGIPVVIVTNAPYYQAFRRVYKLGLLKFIDGMLAWEGFMPLTKDSVEKLERVKEQSDRKFYFWKMLSAVDIKPSTYSYELIADYYSDYDKYVVGDNIRNDLVPAKKIGMTTIFARYGTQCEKSNIETLLRVTKWSEDRKSKVDEQDFLPDYSVDTFADLLYIMNVPHQLPLL